MVQTLFASIVSAAVLFGCGGGGGGSSESPSSDQTPNPPSVPSDGHSATPVDASQLDATFGSGGIVTTQVGGGRDYAVALAQQTDGRIVVAGTTWNGNDMDFLLLRYNANGSLDPTLGGGGIVRTPVTAFNDWTTSMALQTDGKIIVAGYSILASGQDAVLVRYNTDGSLDTSFGGGDGKVILGIRRNDFFHGVAVQGDGRIVAVGSTTGADGGNSDAQTSLVLVRFNPDGSLDASFGQGGTVLSSIGNHAIGYALILQPDGRIVVAGQVGGFAVLRYNPDGALDTTFSGDGLSIPGALPPARAAIALQADGKIVAAGVHGELQVFRLNANGTLDATFSGDGLQTTPVTGASPVHVGVAIYADGKVVAVTKGVGGQLSEHTFDFALVLHNADGSHDTRFAGDGVAYVPVGFGHEAASAVMIQNDGRIVAVGESERGDSEPNLDALTNSAVALVRLVGTGSPPDNVGCPRALAAAAC
jgi:uncharacterized delta-60 repeat protein